MQNYTLQFNEQDLKIIDAALSQVAYGVVAPLINKINQQIHDQQQEKNIPAAD